MSSFTEDLNIVLDVSGKSAKVMAAYEYYLGNKRKSGLVIIREGFKTDGITLPKGFGFLHLVLPKWSYLKAAIVHDALCKDPSYAATSQCGRLSYGTLTQKEVDAEFRIGLIALGMPPIKAHLIYRCVRIYQSFKGFKLPRG